MYCGESEEEARRVGGPGAMAFANSASHLSGVGSVYPSPAYGSQANAVQLRNRPGDVNTSQNQRSTIGTPEQIIASLREWEEVGVDRMVFLINFDQVIPHEKIMDSLRRFAAEVMPALDGPGLEPMTRLPDFDAVEEVGLYEREAVPVGD